jgi:hypothetical protein
VPRQRRSVFDPDQSAVALFARLEFEKQDVAAVFLWNQLQARPRQLSVHHGAPAKIPPDDSSEFDLAQRLPGEAVLLCRSSPTKESQWNSYQPQSK